jgi:uncharacterized protein YcbK (DUF882 family)
MQMDDGFMRRIVALRQSLSFPFVVSSAYRCPDYNDKVSTTGRDGPHTTGRAIDIQVLGEQALDLLSCARSHGITGLGVKQHNKGRFLHLDDLEPGLKRPRPWLWSYP